MQSAATAYPVFYRTYSRKVNGVREHWDEVCLRTLKGLQSIGNLTEDQVRLIDEAQKSLKALTSGRWLWVGGTDWSNKPENYYGSYNCSSTNIVDWHSFGLMMGLAMQGCGTGAVLEPQYIEQLPVIVNRFEVTIKGNVGDKPADQRLQQTRTTIDYPWNDVLIEVGDSREGWVKSYEDFLKLSSDAKFDPEYVVHVTVDLSNVRPSGEALKGFGGVANPVKVESLYTRCAEILSKAVGRKLNSVECCLLIDEAALVVVAGNIRRCLPKGSLVHTQSGLVPIEKMRIGDMVLTSKGFYPVTDFFDQGEQALCRIETVEGHVLECTKDHKIAIDISGDRYQMIKAQYATTDDRLLALDATTGKSKRVAITSIEYDVRTDHTFDIEVSTVHEFVCNGLLVSNSAGMRQFSENDTLGMTAKDNLWQQNAVTGKWQIDPERDALRMANHTRVFHHKPSLDECIASVTKQYFSGEGAIQYAPEAVARANADLLPIDSDAKTQFLKAYEDGIEAAKKWLVSQFPSLTERELEHRFQRYGLNPCGEIIGSNFFCNLAEIHLNQISPTDFVDQEKAFMAGALSVSVLLNHQFVDQRYKESREADPIVGVSITGLFDFFVNAFGANWLQWWADGRCDWYLKWSEFVAICPDNQILTQFDIDLESYQCMIDDRVFYSCSQLYRDLERHYLSYWRMITFETVAGYCEHHGLKTPSRCTTVQPSGSKSLLTGASPGWHPPKAQRFIRRITFRKNDPVALACIDYGYNVIPSQSDKDENGHLLDDPFDPRCTEWLVEIPVEVPWANLDGADKIDISRFSALAQFDFYMQVQKYYTSHNTSSTIELRQHEIEALAKRIYDAIQNDEGYISSALLARFDDLQTFPRLPFEPIDKRTYDRLFAEMLLRRKELDFHEALMKYDDGGNIVEAGPAGCDSDKCLISGSK